VFVTAVCLGSFSAAPQGWATPVAEARQQVRFLDLQTVLPSDWQQVDPSSSMRLLQFVVPGDKQGQSAELIFYYFGAGQGGTPQANIARWQSQFHAANGLPSTPQVVRFEVSGLPVTRVKLQGSYARGIGAGPGGTGKPDQTLIAALLRTPQGQVTIQLHGDTSLIDALEPDFDRMLHDIAPLSAR
jgi:hypothetical protein